MIELPAFKWKMINLIKLQKTSEEKFAYQEQALIEAVDQFRDMNVAKPN